MKRFFVLISVLALCGVLVSCNKKDDTGVTKSYTKYKVSSVQWNGEGLSEADLENSPIEGFFYKNIGMTGTDNPKWKTYPGKILPMYDANNNYSGDFEYAPGHEYVLLICIRKWTPDKNLADDFGISYSIESVLSDEERNTPMDPDDINYYIDTWFPFGG